MISLKAWFIGSDAFIDIEDAVFVVVGLVPNRERAIYDSTHTDAHNLILKEARADLLNMRDGDILNFLGVLITSGYIPLGL